MSQFACIFVVMLFFSLLPRFMSLCPPQVRAVMRKLPARHRCPRLACSLLRLVSCHTPLSTLSSFIPATAPPKLFPHHARLQVPETHQRIRNTRRRQTNCSQSAEHFVSSLPLTSLPAVLFPPAQLLQNQRVVRGQLAAIPWWHILVRRHGRPGHQP